MGYSVKWINDNLGVTRKALRVLEDEKYKLLPARTQYDKDERIYRDFSDEEVSRIWLIKILQGIGFSLQEISEIYDQSENDKLNFQDALSNKVKELESIIAEKERHLGYAKAIKLTGFLPMHPSHNQYMNFEEFRKKAIDEWNINNDPSSKQFQEFIEEYTSETQNYDNPSINSKFLNFIDDWFSNYELEDFDPENVIFYSKLIKKITDKKEFPPSHPEVQILIKLLQETEDECFSQLDLSINLASLTAKEYSEYILPKYLVGDFAAFSEKAYGKDGCLFLADAIAIYGGYKNSDDFLDKNT